MVPHFITTRQAGVLSELEKRLLDMAPTIERWLRSEWMNHPPIFSSTVLMRNASFKMSVVDSYLYPSNWQYFSPAMFPSAVQAVTAGMERSAKNSHNVLLVARRGDESADYLGSLIQLRTIFELAGFVVRVGTLDPKVTAPKLCKVMVQNQEESVLIEPLQRERGRLVVEDFFDCSVIFNDYLQDGIPGFIQDITNRIIEPPLQAAWYVRRRSLGYQCYEDLCKRLGAIIGADPWLLYADYERCGPLDLSEAAGIEVLKNKVDVLLSRIRRKHREYAYDDKPFVVLKRDDMRYGTIVLPSDNFKSIEEICKKFWQYPSMVEGATLPQFVLQEGIFARDMVQDCPAEMTVNTINRYVVGAYYRTKPKQVRKDHGVKIETMERYPLGAAEESGEVSVLKTLKIGGGGRRSGINYFYPYGVIARLSTIASGMEMEQTSIPES